MKEVDKCVAVGGGLGKGDARIWPTFVLLRLHYMLQEAQADTIKHASSRRGIGGGEGTKPWVTTSITHGQEEGLQLRRARCPVSVSRTAGMVQITPETPYTGGTCRELQIWAARQEDTRGHAGKYTRQVVYCGVGFLWVRRYSTTNLTCRAVYTVLGWC